MERGEFGVSTGMLEIVEDREGKEVSIVVVDHSGTIDHLDVGGEFPWVAIAFVAEGLTPFSDGIEPFEDRIA